jgi:hypothetical protein
MAEDGSLDFRLVQRVCQLQQALDQALDSLMVLKQRLRDQQVIEHQLAQTERYANVQRQLIVHFQQQVAQQRHWQEQILQALILQGESTFDRQRVVLERLRSRLCQGYAALQDYLLNLGQFGPPPQPNSAGPGIALEAEVRVARLLILTLSRQIQAAQTHLQQLDTGLNDYQTVLLNLQTALAEAVADQAEAAEDSAASPDTADPDALETARQPDRPPEQQWRYQLRSQHHRIEQLEGELSQQFQVQARLQHQCQAVSAQRDYYQQQFALARQQNAQLRSQLLQTRPVEAAAPGSTRRPPITTISLASGGVST